MMADMKGVAPSHHCDGRLLTDVKERSHVDKGTDYDYIMNMEN